MQKTGSAILKDRNRLLLALADIIRAGEQSSVHAQFLIQMGYETLNVVVMRQGLSQGLAYGQLLIASTAHESGKQLLRIKTDPAAQDHLAWFRLGMEGFCQILGCSKQLPAAVASALAPQLEVLGMTLAKASLEAPPSKVNQSCDQIPVVDEYTLNAGLERSR